MIDIVLEGAGKNALSTIVMAKALDDLRAARGKPVLLRGNGDAFSAGLNLKEVASLDADGMERFLALLDDLVVALVSHDAPIVAWVNGHAIAGGCVLALACDMRIGTANPKVLVGLNEVAIGLAFPPRILRLAELRVPAHRRARVLLDGALFSPADALDHGLLDEVSEDAESLARKRLDRLSSHPREAFTITKLALNRPLIDLDPRDLADYRDKVLPRWKSQERRAALLAVLTKP